MSALMPVRTSAKALIVRNGCLLVQENVDARGTWFLLPGGGQERGETLPQALQRECLEEIGTPVQIGPLRFVRDYIGGHHEFAATNGQFHQVEFMFACEVPDEYAPAAGHTPDSFQTGVRWLPLAELAACRFYPQALIRYLTDPGVPAVVYLGDVN